MKIQYIDTDGIKGSLPEGYLGYDKATADRGRVAVGTNTGDALLAKKSEVDSHISATNNPHTVTKTQVGLGNVDNTADSAKVVASAGKWTTSRTLSLTGDVTGSVNFDGSDNVSVTTTVVDDSHNHVISNVDGLQAALDLKANDSTVVKLTESQTISGVKTFSLSPIVPTPTANIEAANKAYVDTKVSLTEAQTVTGTKTFSSTIVGNITGNSATATKLATARTINGVAFDGSANITVSDATAVKLTENETISGVKTFSSNIIGNVTGNLSGNATSATNATNATKLSTPRQINGVNFDGSADITVVDSTKVALTGNETIAGTKTFSSTIVGNITGNSATASKLATARTIGGVLFDGTANINLPGVNATGNQSTTGNSATATTLTGLTATVAELNYVDGVTSNIQTQLAGKLDTTATAAVATKLATARTINGVAFDGSANITVSDATAVKLTGNETIAGTKTFSSTIVGNITGNSATATKLATARTINGVSFDGTANITAPTNLGIEAGTTAGPIVTSSTGTNVTLPSASATASGVVTTGAQTFAGVKTFSSNPISTATQATAVDALTRKDYVDTKVAKVTSTDNAIVRFNGTTGEVQNSGVFVDDNSNVGIGLINNGGNKLQVNGSIGVVGGIDTTSASVIPEITKEMTRTLNNYGGASILNSAFGDVPTCGELYVYEIGTGNYLNATFFKRGASYQPNVTVLASSGLTLGVSNPGGTQVVNGATGPNNIRMMSKIRKLYT